jgi:hypothetical protein
MSTDTPAGMTPSHAVVKGLVPTTACCTNDRFALTTASRVDVRARRSHAMNSENSRLFLSSPKYMFGVAVDANAFCPTFLVDCTVASNALRHGSVIV